MTTAVGVVAVEVVAVEVVGAVAGVSLCSSATCPMTPGMLFGVNLCHLTLRHRWHNLLHTWISSLLMVT